jgi:transcriptional regulator of heat shock response
MKRKVLKQEQVANLIEKIDKKKKELQLLRKSLQKAFNDISAYWKEESAIQFPQLTPCNIGELVGVDVTVKGRVYNVFVSEYHQQLYCMFCLDRKDDENRGLSLKKAMEHADLDKISVIVNDYLSQNNQKVGQAGDGYFVKFPKKQYEATFLFYMSIVRIFMEL